MKKLKEDFGIRALFGVVLILSFVISIFIAMNKGIEILGTVKDVYAPLIMAVIAFYFGTRAKQ